MYASAVTMTHGQGNEDTIMADQRRLRSLRTGCLGMQVKVIAEEPVDRSWPARRPRKDSRTHDSGTHLIRKCKTSVASGIALSITSRD